QRVSRQTGHPVIAVSKSMQIIALFIDGIRTVLEDSAAILSHANQALATLEIEDLATIRDVTAVAQRLEMVRRTAAEIEGYMVELGTDGRLLSLHLDELVAGTAQERGMLAQDYRAAPPQARPGAAEAVLARVEALPLDELLDTAAVAAVLGFGGADALDDLVSPHGYRLLARVPRIPGPAVASLIEHFGGLQKLLAAGVE